MRYTPFIRTFSSAISFLIALSFYATCTAQNNDAEIREVIDKLFKGMKSGDSAMVRSVFLRDNSFSTISKNSRDSVIVRSDGNAEGFIKAVGTAHKEIWDERIYDVVIKTDGPMAIVWAPYKFFLGDTFSHCGVNVFTIIQTANGWKIKEITDTRRKTDCPSS